MNTRRRFGSFALALLATLLLAPKTMSQDATKITQTDAAQADTKQDKPPRPTIYDESADARQMIAEAVARAKKNNRRVLVQWGANWCGWCHLLHGTFKENRTVARKLLYEYDLVLVDVGRFDKNLDLADEYGADLKGNGLPFLTVLDANGDTIANQETASLEKKGGEAAHDPERVMEFLTKHEAEPLIGESVLADGLRAAQKKDKLVFLHFGAPWCGWCHRLENWMALDIVEPILAREFVDVKIDIDRMVGGKEIMAKYRKVAGGGIPWFAFVNGKGEVVATSNVGPNDSNLGCPYSPDEIAAFGALLAKVTDLGADDLERITAKLGKQEETPKKADTES